MTTLSLTPVAMTGVRIVHDVTPVTVPLTTRQERQLARWRSAHALRLHVSRVRAVAAEEAAEKQARKDRRAEQQAARELRARQVALFRDAEGKTGVRTRRAYRVAV